MIHQNDHDVALVTLAPHMNDLGHSVPLNPRICDFTQVVNAKNTNKAISRNLTGTRLEHQAQNMCQGVLYNNQT